MRYLKVLVIFIISIILGSLLSNNIVKAHSDNLGIDGADDITYDSCIPDLFEDTGGYSEVWYELAEYKDYNEVMDHIDDDIDIIYYKIHLDNTDVDWGSEVLSNIDNIKKGIDQWNQISVYKEDENGRLHAYPLVRFVDVDDLEDASNVDVNVDIYFDQITMEEYLQVLHHLLNQVWLEKTQNLQMVFIINIIQNIVLLFIQIK